MLGVTGREARPTLGDGLGGLFHVGVTAVRVRSRQPVARPPCVPAVDRQRN